MAGPITCCATIIDDAAQGRKKLGCTVDFIDHDELAHLGTQEGVGIVQPPAIDRALEVQIHGSSLPSRGDMARQRGLTNLPRAEQDHARHVAEAILDEGLEAAGDHFKYPGNLTTDIKIPGLIKSNG